MRAPSTRAALPPLVLAALALAAQTCGGVSPRASRDERVLNAVASKTGAAARDGGAAGAAREWENDGPRHLS